MSITNPRARADALHDVSFPEPRIILCWTVIFGLFRDLSDLKGCRDLPFGILLSFKSSLLPRRISIPASMAPKSNICIASVICRFNGEKHSIPIARAKKITRRFKSGEKYQTYVKKNVTCFEAPIEQHESCPKTFFNKEVHYLTCMFSTKLEEIKNPVVRNSIKKSFEESFPAKEHKERTRAFVAAWLQEKRECGMDRILETDIHLIRNNYGFTKTHVDQCYTAELTNLSRVFAVLQKDALFIVAYKYNWAELQLTPSLGKAYAFHSIDFLNDSMRDYEARAEYTAQENLCVQVRVVRFPVVSNWVPENTSDTYMDRFATAMMSKLQASP